jgi:DNA-binding response OmpR family regulator
LNTQRLARFSDREGEAMLSDVGHEPTILIADDDDDVRALLAYVLLKAGFDAEVVDGGGAALAAAARRRRKVLILDVSMPGVSGLDVCREVKAREDGSCSILLVSANATDSDIAAGFAAGADDYLPKPFSPRVLVERVAVLIGRQ